MKNENENIIIKRVKKKTSSSASAKDKKSISKKVKFETQYQRQIKILALLLSFISFLVLLALVSYSTKDEANTQISFHELIQILRGQEEVIARVQSTHNWLGLLGAIISNFLYNSTIGITVIFIPMLVIYWSKYLFFTQKFDKKIYKVTVVTLTFGLLFSTFFGILAKIEWLGSLPKELIGNFGYFTSNIMTGILGVTGATIIFILIIFSLFFLVFKINPVHTTHKFKELIGKTKAIFGKLKKSKNDEQVETSEVEGDDTDIEIHEEEYDDEPARLIKNNIDNNGVNINPIDNPLKAFTQTVKDVESDETNDSSVNDNIHINSFENDSIPAPPTENKQEETAEQKAELHSEDMQENDINGELESEEDEQNNDIPNSEVKTGNDKKLVITVTETEEEVADIGPINLLGTSIHDREINYKPPRFDLLIDDEYKYEINEDELKLNARILQDKLETFKIEIQNLSVTPGPVVTQYEFVPAPGIKISKIESLSDDIAMALKARGIRIIAPIPGKGTVGIEIPNKKPMLVRFGSCIKSPKYLENDYRLPICLGKTISGEVFVTDLSKMPHLLMAGATGTGKSIGINTMIASLIYKIHPKYLKFVIIDPKKVELTQYSALKNHFLACSPDVDSSIITDPQDAVTILQALTAEMDLRYDILSQVGQRNIFDYNKRVREGRYKNDKELVHKEMPYIIVVIDELADLMLTASKEVEAPIIRLAQLARAVGIHLILATQRPSVDVITGIIKANFPARLSYLVASKIDSRTILDVMGAEKLLGNGDLLFQFGGSTAPMRIQNAFLSTEEVENICEFIGMQKGYGQPYMLPSLDDNSSSNDGVAREDRDVLFNESARLVVRLQQASVSLIQRRMKVGYARAGRIIDELEAVGIVGPFDGSKARTVLIETEDELEHLL